MHSSAPSRRTNEPQPADETDPAALSLDTIFEILSNERRRRTCRYLLDDPDGVVLGTLAEHIAAAENDKSVTEISSQERKRVYVGLYQCHLPKMDAAGVVAFDADRKSIEPGPTIEQVTTYLPESEDKNRASEEGVRASFFDFTRAVGGLL